MAARVDVTDAQHTQMASDFSAVVATWMERLGADGYGVDAPTLRRALQHSFARALDYTLEDCPADEGAHGVGTCTPRCAECTRLLEAQ